MGTAELLPNYLTDFQVADWLGVPVARVRRWIKQGAIPHRLLPDGSVLFDPSELAQWSQSLPRVLAATACREVAGV